MNLRILVFSLAALLICSSAYAEILDVVKATVRIKTTRLRPTDEIIGGKLIESVQDTYGTGWIIRQDETHYFIATAGHVVDNDKETTKFRVQFFYPTPSIYYLAERINLIFEEHAHHRDLAILKVKRDSFERPSLPVADKELEIGSRILTFGCPDGGSPTMYFGRVYSTSAVGVSIFPYPRQGRSGSALLDENGEKVQGVVVRTNGYSISAHLIRRFLERTLALDAAETETGG